MSAKAKFLFVLGIIEILLLAFVAVDIFMIGMPVYVTVISCLLAALFASVIFIGIIGFKRVFKFYYFVLVCEIVCTAVVEMLVGNILSIIVWALIAVLMVASLFPVVFKNM